jgi:6-phosphogluconolactonase
VKVLVFDDAAAMAREAGERFRAAALRAVDARGRFTCALTGSTVVPPIYEQLALEPVDWARVHFFWGDDRAVPPDHPDSNALLAQRHLIGRVSIPPENVHRMQGEEPDLDAAARGYERELARVLGTPPVLDLVHHGVGPDGHVASLYPGHPAVEVRDRTVVGLADSPKPPPRRLTLTLPVLESAREIWFFVAGAAKAPMVREVLEDPRSDLPAARLTRAAREAIWFLDRAAAARLGEART